MPSLFSPPQQESGGHGYLHHGEGLFVDDAAAEGGGGGEGGEVWDDGLPGPDEAPHSPSQSFNAPHPASPSPAAAAVHFQNE